MPGPTDGDGGSNGSATDGSATASCATPPSLADRRAVLDALGLPGGRFVLRCARTGERPIPAGGHRFPSRAVARRAARVTEQYRAALRQYDPALPVRAVIVVESTPPGAVDHESCPTESGAAAGRGLSPSVVDRHAATERD